MEHGLKALLGCVQSAEVSGFHPSDRVQSRQSRMLEHVLLPLPQSGTHLVGVPCKYCQQTVRVRVQSRGGLFSKRLAARLALAVSVCLWTAGAALLLLYALTGFPQAPGREVVWSGVLILLGIGVWTAANAGNAFAGDVGVGCRIERTPEEERRLRQVPRENREAIPSHVLLEPEYARSSLGTGVWRDDVVVLEPAQDRVGTEPPRIPAQTAAAGSPDARPGDARSA